MELTTFAYIIGTLMFLVCLPMLVSPDKTVAFLKKVIEDDTSLRTWGGIYVVVSILVLKEGIEIGTDASGLFTLLAWAMFVKGLVIAWSPKSIKPMQMKVLNNKGALPVHAIIGVVLGVLCFYGAGLV
ncbi:MAG: hypothetical protein QF755_02115 [Candidatus Peribacteraceae bacterium]|mgnify:FL=1|jgi:uncharacterized membrane protein|nr:hypothetical protein [Candidatus Peribacteraceae bacterium]HCI04255.1 hypothetical protein [Candidatus Peribacteria bacterium]|tara:strand:- start:1250 stop:1633 length:384 start_codon:yes stop_codon:yes gene_type:complete